MVLFCIGLVGVEVPALICLADVVLHSRYDYRFDPEDKKVECLCGAPTCRQFMN